MTTTTVSDHAYTRYSVDLGSGEIGSQNHQCEDLEDVLGGIARGFKLMESCPVEDAYDPNATLLLTLGVLSDSNAMTGLRTYFLAYSPLKRYLTGQPSAMWSAGSMSKARGSPP